MRDRLRLRDERRRRVLDEHEPAVQSALGDEERRQSVRERGIEQSIETTLADAGEPHRRGGERVHRDRDRLTVEVAPRHDVAVLRQHDRVVRDGVQLDLEDAAREREHVAGRSVDLRGAAERVRVLHEVLAVPVRREDRRALEEEPEVRGARGLPRMRAEALEPVVERRVRAEGRLDRHRRNHVGSPGERRQPLGRERPDREHPLRPVHEREAFLRLERERSEARAPERVRGGLGAGLGQHLPRPDQWQREIGERREIAGGAERPLFGHDGDHVGVQHRRHQIDQLRADARVTEREDVGAEEQHRTRLRPGERTPDRRRVRTNDPVLEVGGLRRVDPHVRERAETRGDAVDDVAGADGILDDGPSRDDALPRAGRECDLGTRRDRGHVRQRERLPDRDRHGAKATTRRCGRCLRVRGQSCCLSLSRSDTSGPVSCIT